MSATQARRERRESQRVITSTVDLVWKIYKIDPNGALAICHELFGEEKYTKALRGFIHQHKANVAFVLATRKCFEMAGKKPSTVNVLLFNSLSVEPRHYTQWADEDTARALDVVERDFYPIGVRA